MIPIGVQDTYTALAVGVLFTYTEEFESIQITGNGYRIQLLGCREDGFNLGDTEPVRSREVYGIQDGRNNRLGGDLLTFGGEQVSR
jgi:hypothetical protein